MSNALWITLIGMGLVFAAILVLWGLMALLVKVTEQPEEPEAEAPEGDALPELAAAAEVEALQERKRQAAAAAVALALAMQEPAVEQPQPTGSLSAWQAVHRASQLSQRGYSSRKKVIQ